MIDIDRALKTTMATGEVVLGVKQTLDAVNDGRAKLVILARNCPNEELMTGDLKVKVFHFEGHNKDLGTLCGKPFGVSAMAVIDKGSSNILLLC